MRLAGLRFWAVLTVIGGFTPLASADVIVTADGETISGHEVKVVDGEFEVPGDGGTASRKWSLVNLQRVSFGASRPTSELKTRFVRIELPGDKKLLHMAEVQVFEGEENVALKGKASQSSLYQNTGEERWGPQKAIDGNTSGDSKTAGTTHTNMESNPWWEVDLGRDVTVKKIVVWNRMDDNVGSRIARFRVVLLDEKRNPLWTRSFAEAPPVNVEMEVPTRGDAFSETDTQAFDQFTGRTAASGALSSLVNWLTGTPAQPQTGAAPAANPQPGTSASPQAASSKPTEIPDGAWLFQLTNGGRVAGKLQSWTTQGAAVECTISGQAVPMTVPSTAIREVLSKDVATQTTPLDRTQVSSELDTVFAKVQSGALQAVAGKVKSVDGESLLFEYQGKDRRIAMSRVMAIFLHSEADEKERPFPMIDLRGGFRIPGTVTALANPNASIETLWGQKFEVPRSALIELVVRNGRVTSLTELEPTKVEHVPFLDRILPHTVNQSLNGNALQVDSTTFDRGLCLHSRTVLSYELDSRYAQLRTKLGLQKGDGDRGNALVRVLSDGAVLFEKQFNGSTPLETIELDTAGKQLLTLEVDYGENMDIGDHVVFGDPVLVRPAAP